MPNSMIVRSVVSEELKHTDTHAHKYTNRIGASYSYYRLNPVLFLQVELLGTWQQQSILLQQPSTHNSISAVGRKGDNICYFHHPSVSPVYLMPILWVLRKNNLLSIYSHKVSLEINVVSRKIDFSY